MESRKVIKLRGIVAMIFAVLTVLAAIVLTIVFLASGDAKSVGDAIGGAAVFSFSFGGLIPGFSHIDTIFSKLKFLLYIPVAGWVIFLILILGVPMFGGWIFMLVDFVKYMNLKKKEKTPGAASEQQYAEPTDVLN